MGEVLYRKYRPKSFAQVEGQDIVVQILKESISRNKLSHAYLFCGPRGCGKTTMARIMAKAVNCTNFSLNNDICNECDNCLAITNGSVDVVEMDAASNRGIEEIRVLRDTINFVPNFLRRKVYIIDEAHMLTKEAFNALLKTLEEPPDHVIFILATTESHKLPSTILSRVTRFDFKLGSESSILNKLAKIIQEEGLSLSQESLKMIYSFSGGSFRDSESVLSKVILTSQSSEISDADVKAALGIAEESLALEFINSFIKKDVAGLLEIVDVVSKKSDNVSIFLDQVLNYVNNELIEGAKGGSINFVNINIANLAIKIKSEIKDFSNKSTIASLAIINYFNKDISIQENAKEKAQIEKPVTHPLVIENLNREKSNPSHNTVPMRIENIDSSVFIERVLSRASGILPRLKGMLATAQIDLGETEVVVKTPYRVNLMYMQKKE